MIRHLRLLFLLCNLARFTSLSPLYYPPGDEWSTLSPVITSGFSADPRNPRIPCFGSDRLGIIYLRFLQRPNKRGCVRGSPERDEVRFIDLDTAPEILPRSLEQRDGTSKDVYSRRHPGKIIGGFNAPGKPHPAPPIAFFKVRGVMTFCFLGKKEFLRKLMCRRLSCSPLVETVRVGFQSELVRESTAMPFLCIAAAHLLRGAL